MTCPISALAPSCPSRRKPLLSRLMDWLRAEARAQRDMRHIFQLELHLLRDAGLDETDLHRALHRGRHSPEHTSRRPRT